MNTETSNEFREALEQILERYSTPESAAGNSAVLAVELWLCVSAAKKLPLAVVLLTPSALRALAACSGAEARAFLDRHVCANHRKKSDPKRQTKRSSPNKHCRGVAYRTAAGAELRVISDVKTHTTKVFLASEV